MGLVERANHYQKTIQKAALIAGIGILIMALTVPWVEFYIFPKIVNYNNPDTVVENILNNSKLFSTAIFIQFTTVICDVIVTWALYMFFKPFNKNLALLTSWFRIVYVAFNITAILNLIQIVSLLKIDQRFDFIQPLQLKSDVLFYLSSFDMQWRFGFIFFGIYLILLGYLAFKTTYVQKYVALVLIIAGLGYIIDNSKYFLYPGFDTGFLWFTYFGELVFMFWLLIKGTRIKIETSQENKQTAIH